MLPACYTGLDGRFDDDGAASDPGLATPDTGPGGSGGGDDGDDGPANQEHHTDPGQIRLLSAPEYRNTIHDLLGVEASEDLSYAEVSSGYDNGADNQLGESLFSILSVEAERVAGEYVVDRMPQEFPCFDASVDLSDGCVASVVEQLGKRAFRRPVDAATRAQLVAFGESIATDAQDSTEAMELLVARILMSPRFLYRTEIGHIDEDNPSIAVLDSYEKASLISYSVVGSMPDPALMADADADDLDSERIRHHVRRLMATDRGRAQVVSFFKQWLRVTELDYIAESPEDFAKLDSPEQAEALRDEFDAFVARVIFEDGGTMADLLLQEVTYANRHTAHLYGATSTSDELERIELDAEQRGGVLTLASVMAVHASGAEIERDKPIRRGLLVKNQLLCETVGLPSGLDVNSAAEAVIDEVDNFELLTTREQLELIMNQDEVCVACHATFMPYGFLWGNFDALGQYQTHLGEHEIDTTVADLSIDGQAESYGNIMEMLPELANSQQVADCFTTNYARYTTGRGDSKIVDRLTTDLSPVFVDNDRDILQLFEDILANPELFVRKAAP